jgi:hypothetical protein
MQRSNTKKDKGRAIDVPQAIDLSKEGNHIAASRIDTSLSNDFKLERYKYMLQEIHTLNENVHKYLTLFHTLATAIITGGVIIFISWKQLNIGADVARQAVEGLL